MERIHYPEGYDFDEVQESREICAAADLTADEAELLDRYRGVRRERKKEVLEMIRAM